MNQPVEALPNEVISVLIADADRMSADLIAGGLTRGRHDISVVGVSNNSLEAIKEIERHRPNIVLINARLDDGPLTGFLVLQSLPHACSETAAIMMVPVSERDLVVDAFRGGARGVFCRAQPIKLLSKCIRIVHEGQIWANNQNLDFVLEFLTNIKPLRLAKPGGGMGRLTPREAEVVRLLADGMSTREISHKAGVTEHTIRNYLSNIYEKLGVSSRVELALYAVTRQDMGHSSGN
jgi:two-component system nitrate/nitrite response regulator NarL